MLLDLVTLFVFAALTTDILIQTKHIYKRQSSLDISIKGCSIRLIAAVTLIIKFFAIEDFYLILGQSIFAMSYLAYFILLIHYRK